MAIIPMLNSGALPTTYRRDLLLLNTPGKTALLLAGAATVLTFPFLADNFWLFVINAALLTLIGVVALHMLTGFTGLVSMAHVAFLALGGTVVAVLSVQNGLPLLLSLPVCALAGAVVGALVGLPVLRLRGLYLILATLALHFIALYLFKQYQVKYFGTAGILFDAPTFGPLTIDSEFAWYWLAMPVAALSCLLLRNLRHSREGRALIAIHTQEIAAETFGIRAARSKILVFAISSAMVTFSGGLIALHISALGEEGLTLDTVIRYYLILIIGGMGARVAGPLLGVAVFTGLQEVLSRHAADAFVLLPVVGERFRQNASFSEPLVFGLILILVLALRPGGVSQISTDLKKWVLSWPYRR